MHICIGNQTTIDSGNGLLPGLHKAINWTNAGILLIGPFSYKLKRHFNHSSYIFIQENAFENIICKIVAILSQCVNPVA